MISADSNIERVTGEWTDNKSTTVSTGESIVAEIERLFFASGFVKSVEISTPLWILIKTKSEDRGRRKNLYMIQKALHDKYPNVLFNFNIEMPPEE